MEDYEKLAGKLEGLGKEESARETRKVVEMISIGIDHLKRAL